jgi:hypothetical protein
LLWSATRWYRLGVTGSWRPTTWLAEGDERPRGTQFEDFSPRRKLDRPRRKESVRTINDSDRDRVLAGDKTLGCFERVTWVAPNENPGPQTQKTRHLCDKLQGRVTQRQAESERQRSPSWRNQSQSWTFSQQEWRTCAETVYHLIKTGGARPICQPPLTYQLAKNAEVNEMLKDIKPRGVFEETVLGLRPSCSSGRTETFVLCGLQKAKWRQSGFFPLPRNDVILDKLVSAQCF